MSTLASADAIRFPPDLSARIASEIEAIAWNETELPGAVPEQDRDATYLASIHADQAASMWEEANDCPEGYLPYRIVDAARRALIARIEAAIARCDEVENAANRRVRPDGSTDASDAGEMAIFHGMIDERLASPSAGPDMTSGRESDQPGPIGPEVLVMSRFAKKGVVAFWHFECPECGFGDAEFGGPASSADSTRCEVCLEDGKVVRLKRWSAEEFVPDLRAA